MDEGTTQVDGGSTGTAVLDLQALPVDGGHEGDLGGSSTLSLIQC